MENASPKKKSPGNLGRLFLTNLALSAFTFGGGFVIVSLMKKKYVEELKWLEEDEMLDIAAIAQSCPGPIAINAASILGYRTYGILGSIVAVTASSLPPLVILSLIAVFYAQFSTNPYIGIALQVMRAGVAAVIFDVVINLAKNVLSAKRVFYILMMAGAFIVTYFLNVNVVLVIIFCLFMGIVDAAVDAAKEGGKS